MLAINCWHVIDSVGARRCTAALLLLAAAAGCGSLEVQDEPLAPSVGSLSQALESENGLSFNGLSSNGLSSNGLSFNGLSSNGLSFNGLSFNGLSSNGLSEAIFSQWFEQNPQVAEQLMRYVVRCAVPAGESRTYEQPGTGQRHTWPGLLGLAPGWAAGQPVSEVEQQVLSACLAAHVNRYGLSVPISVLGRDALGQPIPYTSEELRSFSQKEAVFFGNLFTEGVVYACSYRSEFKREQSSVRACGALDDSGEPLASCPPLVHLGSCKHLCTKDEDKHFYESCTWRGTTYRALTTRLRSEDIYRCGDGVCQFTESCGRGHSFNSCEPDCGRCP